MYQLNKPKPASVPTKWTPPPLREAPDEDRRHWELCQAERAQEMQKAAERGWPTGELKASQCL